MELKLVVEKYVEDKFSIASANKRKVEVYEIGNYSVKVVTYPSGAHYITVRKEVGSEYLPDIYCRDNDDGDVCGFEIQTTSYGAISAEETKKMIEALNEAVEVVNILTNKFLKQEEC